MARRVGARLSATKVRSLLASQATAPTPMPFEYSGTELGLADGRVLIVYEDGAGVLYPSREVLDAMLGEVERLAAAGPVDPTVSLLPPSAEFLANARNLASELPSRLGLPKLGDDEADLQRVDDAIARLRTSERLAPALVTSLTAFLGEFLIRAVGGHWSSIESAGNPEPVVIAQHGARVLQPFALAYLELVRGRRGSIRGATRGLLLTLGWRP